MDDEVLVRVCHRLADADEERDPPGDGQAAIVAPAVDALALDVLEHQVALAGRRDAGVEQPGDVGMIEPAEQSTLAREALVRTGVGRGQAHQLDRRQAVVQAVGSARQPDLAHAAAAEQALDQPGAEAMSFEARRSCSRRVARRAEERALLGFLVGADQGVDPGMQAGVFNGQARQPVGARGRRQLGPGFEGGKRFRPRPGLHGACHGVGEAPSLSRPAATAVSHRSRRATTGSRRAGAGSSRSALARIERVAQAVAEQVERRAPARRSPGPARSPSRARCRCSSSPC